MAEQKEFKKKELNKDDYKKDKNIVGGVKKGLGVLTTVAVAVGTYFLKGKIDNTKKD